MLGHSNASPSFKLGNKRTYKIPAFFAGAGTERIGKRFDLSFRLNSLNTVDKSLFHKNGRRIVINGATVSVDGIANTTTTLLTNISGFRCSGKSEYFALIGDGNIEIYNIKNEVLILSAVLSGNDITFSDHGQYAILFTDTSAKLFSLNGFTEITNLLIEGASGSMDTVPQVAQFLDNDSTIFLGFSFDSFISIGYVNVSGTHIGEVVSYFTNEEMSLVGKAKEMVFINKTQWFLATDSGNYILVNGDTKESGEGVSNVIFFEELQDFIKISTAEIALRDKTVTCPISIFSYRKNEGEYGLFEIGSFLNTENKIEFIDINLSSNEPIIFSGIAASEEEVLVAFEDFSGHVPESRKINGKDLYSDINLDIRDLEDSTDLINELLNATRVKVLDENFIVPTEPIAVVKTQLID